MAFCDQHQKLTNSNCVLWWFSFDWCINHNILIYNHNNKNLVSKVVFTANLKPVYNWSCFSLGFVPQRGTFNCNLTLADLNLWVISVGITRRWNIICNVVLSWFGILALDLPHLWKLIANIINIALPGLPISEGECWLCKIVSSKGPSSILVSLGE